MPAQEIRVPRCELVPRQLARAAEPVRNQQHERDRDRLVIPIRFALPCRESLERGAEPLERHEDRIAPQIAPRHTHM